MALFLLALSTLSALPWLPPRPLGERDYAMMEWMKGAPLSRPHTLPSRQPIPSLLLHAHPPFISFLPTNSARHHISRKRASPPGRALDPRPSAWDGLARHVRGAEPQTR